MALYHRGAPICKLTDIPITDISAINTTDADTNIATSINLVLLLILCL